MAATAKNKMMAGKELCGMNGGMMKGKMIMQKGMTPEMASKHLTRTVKPKKK